VLDDLSSGTRGNLPAGVELIKGDIADPRIVDRALAGAAGCFHLAAIASVERGVRDWVGTHQTNLSGTITLLDAIRRGAAPIPFVYASSAAVYGEITAQPLTEDTRPSPLSAYGADKYGCELHAAVATKAYGIPTVGLRFFNVYGPRQNPRSPYSGVISIFCAGVSRGAPVDVYGDGLQTRDFVFVEAVVRALMRAMERRFAGPAVFNVCTGSPVSVLELAGIIGVLCGRTPVIRFHAPRLGEVRHSTGCAARVREALALPEPTQLRTGLAQVLDWLGAAQDA
jgi:UDP-glucose 4-epimerase